MSPLILVGGLGALALLVVASGSKPGDVQPKPLPGPKDLTKEQLQAKMEATLKRNKEFGSSSGSVRSTESPCDKPADAAAAKRCEDIALIRGKCDMRLLALPDADFMNVVSVVRTAKDGASLRAVADTLGVAGFKDAASCLRDRADQFDTDLKSISGLHTTTECDRRLLSLPASIFADVVEASKSTDKNLLKLLSKALRDDGFDAAARCLDDRIAALTSAKNTGGDGSSSASDGSSSASDFVPDLKKKTLSFTAADPSKVAEAFGGTTAVAPATEALFDDAVKDITNAGTRATAKDLLMKLHALDAGGTHDGLSDAQLAASGYTVRRLLNFAWSIRDEAPAAFAAIKHAADRLNVIRYWREFALPSPWNEEALGVLSGFRVTDQAAVIPGVSTGPVDYVRIESATGHVLTPANRDAVAAFQGALTAAGEASIGLMKWLNAYDGYPYIAGLAPPRYISSVDF